MRTLEVLPPAGIRGHAADSLNWWEVHPSQCAWCGSGYEADTTREMNLAPAAFHGGFLKLPRAYDFGHACPRLCGSALYMNVASISGGCAAQGTRDTGLYCGDIEDAQSKSEKRPCAAHRLRKKSCPLQVKVHRWCLMTNRQKAQRCTRKIVPFATAAYIRSVNPLQAARISIETLLSGSGL